MYTWQSESAESAAVYNLDLIWFFVGFCVNCICDVGKAHPHNILGVLMGIVPPRTYLE